MSSLYDLCAVVLIWIVQGSTKVFKHRAGSRATSSLLPPAATTNPDTDTTQTLSARIHAGATLLLLPDPVACFAGASYTQTQTFALDPGGSLALLDWLTAGRAARGEAWAFARYRSTNTLSIGRALAAKDALRLAGGPALAPRLAPYACYATLALAGPALARTAARLAARYAALAVRPRRAPERLVWALAPLAGADGVLVRVAGESAEDVRAWVREALADVVDLIGEDAYRRAFV
jgi:urease accessory protein